MINYVAGNFEIYFPKNSTSVQDIDSMGDSINASLLSFQDEPEVKAKNVIKVEEKDAWSGDQNYFFHKIERFYLMTHHGMSDNQKSVKGLNKFWPCDQIIIWRLGQMTEFNSTLKSVRTKPKISRVVILAGKIR